MKEDRKASLRNWASVLISALAVLVTCLMGPVAFTLKATVKDLVRQELTGYETVASVDVRWKEHQDYENEVFKRWEHELAVVHDTAASGQTNHLKLMMELGNRLSSLETKLDLSLKDHPRNGKSQIGGDQP